MYKGLAFLGLVNLKHQRHLQICSNGSHQIQVVACVSLFRQNGAIICLSSLISASAVEAQLSPFLSLSLSLSFSLTHTNTHVWTHKHTHTLSTSPSSSLSPTLNHILLSSSLSLFLSLSLSLSFSHSLLPSTNLNHTSNCSDFVTMTPGGLVVDQQASLNRTVRFCNNRLLFSVSF